MVEKEIYGTISTLIALISNGAYFISVVRKKTHPHVFSWTIWGVLTGITFFAQRSADAGPGAWHMAVNSAICFIVAGLAVTRGRPDIKRSDIVSFACALVALPLWYLTRQPLIAVLIVIGVEAFAYYPTFRKSWRRPHEELALTYSLDCLRCLISLLAMDSYSLTTVLYPSFIVIINIALVSLLLRRRQILGALPSG
jgi:hypothetical protein